MRAPKRKTEVRRDEIARAALALIAERGMKGLRVAAVARRVGLVPSGIYRHYRGKDAILDAVLAFLGARLSANVRAVAHMEGTALDRLHALFLRHLRLLQINESIPQVIFSSEVHAEDPRRRRTLYAIINGYLAGVAGLIEGGRREGTLRRDVDPAAAAMVFLGLVQPTALVWHLGGGQFDLDARAEAGWALFRRAIEIRTGGRKRKGARAR